MSYLHQPQAGQPKIDPVQAEIQRTEQDLVAAEQLGDGAKVVFLRKKLEQLREKELILLRIQVQGQMHLPDRLLSTWSPVAYRDATQAVCEHPVTASLRRTAQRFT